MTQNPIPTAIVGAGPAGLMAAECLSRQGIRVVVFDHMRSVARKFLIAGRGGLNLSHSEDFETFLTRYGPAADWMCPHVTAFPPQAVRDWADGLGAQTFVGSSGRIFPKAMKATPLLRAWLQRLGQYGVGFRLSHRWRGWDDNGALVFDTPTGRERVMAQTTLLALGGASWPRLGSDGGWRDILSAKGVRVRPLQPANCGFTCTWSERLQSFAGTPLNGIALHFGGECVRGEAVITRTGIEGGAIYALSRSIREALHVQSPCTLFIDLRPDMPLATIASKLSPSRPGQSQSTHLRKALHLSPVTIALLRETCGIHLPTDPMALAACIKAAPLPVHAPADIARAISSAGGIELSELNADMQIARLPSVFAAGEMLDWEAPTGGYLLTGCFATAVAAAAGIARRIKGAQ